MTKENILFSIVGVLLGFIVGFFFANSVNQSGAVSRGAVESRLPPDHPALPGSAAAGRDQQGLQAAAEAAAKEAREKTDSFEAQVRAAESYMQIGRYDDALEFLLRANKLRPDDYKVIVELGNANYEAERFEAAERWYTAALEKKPDDVNVRTDLGLTFYLRKPQNVDRAVEEFRRSLQYDPRHELTLQNITVALSAKGDLAEAQETLARLEQVNPNNRALPALRKRIEKANSTSENSAAIPASNKTNAQ